MAKEDKEKGEGKIQEWAGKAQEKIGEVTGSEEDQASGKVKQGKGKAKETSADIKKDIKKAA